MELTATTPKAPVSSVDVSAARRPGVYVLRLAGRVVWIGAARNPLWRLYAHDTHRRGDPWLPGRPKTPFAFDSVEILPVRFVDDLDAALAEACATYNWTPP